MSVRYWIQSEKDGQWRDFMSNCYVDLDQHLMQSFDDLKAMRRLNPGVKFRLVSRGEDRVIDSDV